MLGIVILNYLTYNDTIACVNSIFNTYAGDVRLYIVDNNSPNDSLECLKEQYEHIDNVTIIDAKYNGGYAFGNNVGLYHAIKDGCSQVLICNSDIVFLENTIEILKTKLAEPNVVITTPNILNPSGVRTYAHKFLAVDKKETLLSLTFLNVLDRKKGYRKLLGFDYNDNTPVDIFSASGSCFMLSADLIKKTGYFDDNTFLGWEEPILGNQVKKMGGRVVFIPSIGVLHLHRGSTKHLGAKSYTMGINSEIYYVKHYLKPSPLYLTILSSVITMRYFISCVQDKSYLKELSFFFKNFYSRMFSADGLNKDDIKRIEEMAKYRIYGD